MNGCWTLSIVLIFPAYRTKFSDSAWVNLTAVRAVSVAEKDRMGPADIHRHDRSGREVYGIAVDGFAVQVDEEPLPQPGLLTVHVEQIIIAAPELERSPPARRWQSPGSTSVVLMSKVKPLSRSCSRSPHQSPVNFGRESQGPPNGGGCGAVLVEDTAASVGGLAGCGLPASPPSAPCAELSTR